MMNEQPAMTSIADFLFPAPAPRSVSGIIRWWEARRLRYNLIVGGTGLLSAIAFQLITWLPPDAHEGFVPFPVIIVFGVLANICYFLGPTVEIALEKLWGRKALPTGPALFRMGLTFSVGLTLLPTLIGTFDWGLRIVRSLFF
jgi:hypothetical protein